MCNLHGKLSEKQQNNLKLNIMNTNFFLTIIIAVVSSGLGCFLCYLFFRWAILKFQSFIKGMIKEIDDDDEAALDGLTDREYNELLMSELRKPIVGVDLGFGKDYSVESTIKYVKVTNFRVIDDPTRINSNDIIFMQ